MNIIALIFSLLMLANSAAPLRSEPTAPPYDLGHGLVYGVDYIDYDDYDEDAYIAIKENLILAVSEQEPEIRKAVYAFDVSASGRIAIVTADKHILVYDNEQKFEYSIKFVSDGDHGVIWAGENVVLLESRGSIAGVLSDKGEVVEVYKINYSDTRGINWSEIAKADERVVGNTRYCMEEYISSTPEEKYMFLKQGTKYLMAADYGGNERCLYEANETIAFSEYIRYSWLVRFIFCGIAAAMFFCIVRIVKKNIKSKITPLPLVLPEKEDKAP